MASYHLPYSCSLMVIAADDVVGGGFDVDSDGAVVDFDVVAVAAADAEDLTSH